MQRRQRWQSATAGGNQIRIPASVRTAIQEYARTLGVGSVRQTNRSSHSLATASGFSTEFYRCAGVYAFQHNVAQRECRVGLDSTPPTPFLHYIIVTLCQVLGHSAVLCSAQGRMDSSLLFNANPAAYGTAFGPHVRVASAASDAPLVPPSHSHSHFL
jgi:hypothetical protein